MRLWKGARCLVLLLSLAGRILKNRFTAAVLFLIVLAWSSGQSSLAQGVVWACPDPRYPPVPDFDEAVISADENVLALMTSELVFLKLAILICARYEWWKKAMPFLAILVPCAFAYAAHLVYLFMYPPGCRPDFSAGLETGFTFGMIWVATAVIHRVGT
jgi:hypothetical protein